MTSLHIWTNNEEDLYRQTACMEFAALLSCSGIRNSFIQYTLPHRLQKLHPIRHTS